MKQRFSPAPFIYALFVVLPIYWLVVTSIKTNKEIFGGINFFPDAPTFASFAKIFSDSAWNMGYVNALIYVVMNVAICIVAAVPAAYAFSRYRFPGDRALFFGLLMFRMMAPAILMVPFVQIFSDIGLFDTHLAVALAHCSFNLPLAIWILEGFISDVPREVDEQARIDGYGFFSFFTRILIPMIAPGIAVTAFFCFMFSWVEALMANGLTAINAKPIAGIMTRAADLLSAQVSLISAASVIGLIPGVILIIFTRKHLARGFSMGRVV